MDGPSAKYQGEQSERHPDILVWPGYKNIPVLGPLPSVPLTIPEALYPVGYFYCRKFSLVNEEDREYYSWVMDRIINGWFTQLYISRNDSEVYLEWCQRYWRVKHAPS